MSKLKIGDYVKFVDTKKLTDQFLYLDGIRRGDYGRIMLKYESNPYDYQVEILTGNSKRGSVATFKSEFVKITDGREMDKLLAWLI